MKRAVQHLQIINVNDEWETPQQIFDKACKKFNLNLIIDVCATEQNKKISCWMDVSNNSLIQDWNYDFFMNPPYSEITTWMDKAYTEHKKHNVDALILVYAKTDTKWWHKYVENIAEVHFIKGRLKFLQNNIIPKYCHKCKSTSMDFQPRFTNNFCPIHKIKLRENVAPYPSCWIIYRKEK